LRKSESANQIAKQFVFINFSVARFLNIMANDLEKTNEFEKKTAHVKVSS